MDFLEKVNFQRLNFRQEIGKMGLKTAKESDCLEIVREETMLCEGDGMITFSDGVCSMELDIMDGKFLSGELKHEIRQKAPRAAIYLDHETGDFVIPLDFSRSNITLTNWEQERRVIDEMYAFFTRVKQEYSEEMKVLASLTD